MSTSPGEILVDAFSAALVTSIGSLFAAGDAALSEIQEGRLQALSAETSPHGAAYRRYAKDPLRTLSRWLVGRVVALSAASVLFSEAIRRAGFPHLVFPLAVLGAVLTYGTFTEVFATLARRQPERIGEMCLLYLRPLEWLVAPLADPLAIIGRAIGHRVPKSRRVDPRIIETEVEWVVSEGEKSGSIENEPAEMIRNVLEFKDLTAREVMVPRLRIRGIEVATPIAEVVSLVAAEKHSRYPVYREHIDNVVGLLYAKDLFPLVRDGHLQRSRLSQVMRTPMLFVSESQPVAAILHDMRARGLHAAIVSDEFGGTSGLLTLEDIIGEIVGDIRDKRSTVSIHTLADGRLVADASTPLAEVSKALGRELPDTGEFESLGGLIVSHAGRVPNVGTTVQVGGLNFIVREADSTRVVTVEIVSEWPPASALPISVS